MLPVDSIVRELQTAIAVMASDADASGERAALAMPHERFEQLRAEAAATCRAARGARVAAMQIEAASSDARGAKHIIDLLRRAVHDYPDEPHAA